MFIELLPCARHCSRHMDTSLNKSQTSLPTAANILDFRYSASHEVRFTDLERIKLIVDNNNFISMYWT